MSLIDTLATHWRLPDSRSTNEIKEDIRQELEFHLAMAAEENERGGMSASEAREDAARRFGDFGSVQSECQSVQLGERNFLQRLQAGMLVAAAASLLLLVVSSYRQQSRHNAAMVGLKHSMDELQSDLSLIADRSPPVVVETFPEYGDIEVDPSASEIRVKFSKPMMDRSWSWCQTGQTFPKSTGPIHYVDSKTCVMPVELEPDTEYVLSINSPNFGNFKDPKGRSAEPYLLCFTTAASN